MKKLPYILLILMFCWVSLFAEVKRVFFKPDGTISDLLYNWNLKKAEETNTEFMDRIMNKDFAWLKDYPYKDIEHSELLAIRPQRDKWRHKGDKKIFIDNTIITKAEKVEAKENALDEELAKETPDPIKALRLQREIEKIKSSTGVIE